MFGMKSMIRSRLLLGVALVGCLTSSGCTVKAPSNDGRGAIEQALKDSIKNNEQLEKSGKLRPSVERALTPELDVSLGRARSRVSNAPRFDVVVNNIPAREFFAGLVKDTSYNIVVDPEITGLVTLNLRQVTIPQVMEAVRDGYGYEYEETAYGFKVYPRRLETRVFRLNYIDVARKGNSYTTLSAGQQVSTQGNKGSSSVGSGGSRDTVLNTGGAINTESDGKFWEVLKQNLDALVSANKDKGSVVVVNSKAGTVIARAYPSELRSIARYLNKVQSVIQRQVIIEAKILEVTLNAEFHSGIDWKLFGFHQNAPQGDAWTFSSAMSIKATSASSGNAFQAAIDLLNYQGSVNVLSSPRVATLNNQKAVIKVGSDRFFITDIGSDVSTGGGSSVTSSSMTLTPFFSGISLDVTPQIDDDENVTIHIHPIVSTVTDDRRSFTVNNQIQSLPMARSEVRESDTVVRAKNGQVIVIGGLMKSESSLYNSGTPGLDQVPVLNGVFKSTARSSGKSELVILLRPIIASNTNWQKQLKEAAINITKMEPDDEYRYNMDRDAIKAR